METQFATWLESAGAAAQFQKWFQQQQQPNIEAIVERAVAPLRDQIQELTTQVQKLKTASAPCSPQPVTIQTAYGAADAEKKIKAQPDGKDSSLNSGRRATINHDRQSSLTGVNSDFPLSEDLIGFVEIDPRQKILSNQRKNFGTSGPANSAHRLGLQVSPASSQHSPPNRLRGTEGGIDLLLVEDVRVSAKIAQSALYRAHWKVEVAFDGERAIELYKAHKDTLRVILMDINLPGMSGIEAAHRIRQIERENGSEPVLIYGLTGNVAHDNLKEYATAGMNGCILKGRLLAEAVKQAMDESEIHPDNFINLAGNQMISEAPFSSPSTIGASASSAQPSSDAYHDVGHRFENVQNAPSQDYQTGSSSSTGLKSPVARLSIANAEKETPPMPKLGLRQHSSSRPSSGVNLLLVEDVRVSAKIAQSSLTRASWKVEVATDGERAIEIYQNHRDTLRVILMDINLPRMSGIEATERIRRLENDSGMPNKVLIFGLTGNVDEENLKQYETAGMNGCILKGRLLAEAVERAVAESHSSPRKFINLQ